MPLSFSSAVSNSVARLSNRKLDFLSGVAKAQLLVVSCLISAKACRSPKSCLERTEVDEGEEKGKGRLGNSLAINSDDEEVVAMVDEDNRWTLLTSVRLKDREVGSERSGVASVRCNSWSATDGACAS